MSKGRIAILDDEPAVREILGEFLRNRGYETALFAEPNALDKHLTTHPLDLLVCDLYLGDITGLDVIKKLRPKYPALDIIVLTGFASVENVIEAFRLGANDYLQKPVNLLLFEAAIERLLEKKRLAREVVGLKDIIDIHRMAETVGEKDNLPELLQLVLRTAVRGASAEAGMIVLFNHEENGGGPAAELAASEGLSASERDAVVNLSANETKCWCDAHGGSDLSADAPAPAVPPKLAFSDRRCFCVPFRQRGRVRGLLQVMRGENFPDFNAQECTSTEVLANNASLAIENARLYKSLEEGYFSSIRSLAMALEAKDPYTGGHAERVAGYSRMMADLTDLDEPSKARLEQAALLHDLGKIGVSDHVLQKEGPLTLDERKQIMEHPTIGDRILSQVPSLAAERLWVYEHHERYDGTGYPRGVGSKEISLPGRILILVEVYDALATVRSYKKAWPVEMIDDHFRSGMGTLYDPETTEIFLELLHTKLARQKAS